MPASSSYRRRAHQGRDYGTDTARVRRIARWLTLATILLILYGSLFPFRFFSLREIDIWGLITGLGFARTSRGDIVADASSISRWACA